MKLWLISQDVNTDYDTYSDAVVAAEDEVSARAIHPSPYGWKYGGGDWAPVESVKVEYIGEAKPNTAAGVICASFNAG